VDDVDDETGQGLGQRLTTLKSHTLRPSIHRLVAAQAPSQQAASPNLARPSHNPSILHKHASRMLTSLVF